MEKGFIIQTDFILRKFLVKIGFCGRTKEGEFYGDKNGDGGFTARGL